MKRTGIFLLMVSLMACQSENKSNSSNAPDTLTFTYDSVKVYTKNPKPRNEIILDTAKAVITYPIFEDEHVNHFLLNKVLNTADSGKNYKSYQDYATGFIKGFVDFQKTNPSWPQTWFLQIKNTIVRQKPGYLSILSLYVDYMGGAHPNTVLSYLNYNTATHQEIPLDSLILPGSFPKLNSIAEQIFRKNEKLDPKASLKDNYFFENDTFKLNQNFTVTDQGLKFLYNPYEIKAYVFGTTELIIPFSQLKGIAKPNSLLSPLQ